MRALSPWARRALSIIRAAGALGTSQHNVAHAMQRRMRDLDGPLRVLVAQGLVARTGDGRYTAKPSSCGAPHSVRSGMTCEGASGHTGAHSRDGSGWYNEAGS
jgi:hypothetical protein